MPTITEDPEGWTVTLADVRSPTKATAASAKREQGRTKTRLVPDPARAPVVAQIYLWRTA